MDRLRATAVAAENRVSTMGAMAFFRVSGVV
jgi:hypothetical protein